ncbi:MAG: VRR-NUC domain-containing protein [bacterium]|nr:VRR-NUC domain-containing protein [bacterium]
MSGDRWTMEDLAKLPADVRRQIEQKLLLVNSHRQESNHQQMLDALEAPWPGKEKVLQAACELVLRCSGWQFFHMPGHAAIGNPCGWPDLIAFGPGQRVLLIELKTARGVVSDRQKKTFDALAALGWPVHICRNARHVEWLIKNNEERL